MIAANAEVAKDAVIPQSAKIWNLAQVRERAVLGENVIVGRGAYIGAGVQIGANSKVQSFALIYEPAELNEGVFIGPAAVLTNDRHPRAVKPDNTQKTAGDWDLVGVTIGAGASIGARAICIAPVTIGRWALVAAGAVVTKDVPDHALVVGVPARQVGWVGRTGEPLRRDEGDRYRFTCLATGRRYHEVNGTLREVDG